MVPVGEVAQVADGHGTAADLHIADRPLAAAHAIQEVLGVVVALVEADGVVAQRFFAQGCGGGLELAAVHQDLALGADEQHAAAVAVDHLHAVGVEVAHAAGGFGVLGRDDLHRAALVHAQAPLGDVEVVRAPVGHHAAGVFAVVAPVREVLMHAARAEHGIVGPHRGRAEPDIPVQAGLHRFLRQVARHRGRTHVHDHLLDLADAPVAHQFAGLAKFVRRPLHGAGLEHPVDFRAAFTIARASRIVSGNGKGGGIAAVGFVPEQLGVSREVLDNYYMLHVAFLDEKAQPEIEKAIYHAQFRYREIRNAR